MEKQFVPYELALKLKELGFDEECIGYYQVVNNKMILFKIPTQPSHTSSQEKVKYIYGIKSIQAPLWQQAFDWFRNEYNLYSEIQPQRGTDLKWDYIIFNTKKQIVLNMEELLINDYEEARLECLKQLIKIVENV